MMAMYHCFCRNTSLRADSPEVLPVDGVGWNSKIHGGTVVDGADEDDVILHRRCEAGTFECSAPDSLEKHWGQRHALVVVINAINEKFEDVFSSVM